MTDIEYLIFVYYVECFVGCADCKVDPLLCEECHLGYYPTFSDDGESVLTCTCKWMHTKLLLQTNLLLYNAVL